MSDELLRAKPEKYQVNRGIGKPVEFKGLKSQYLFIFCGGLLAVFVVFIVLFMAGVNQWLCIGFIVSASLLLVWQTFRLNAKYMTHTFRRSRMSVSFSERPIRIIGSSILSYSG